MAVFDASVLTAHNQSVAAAVAASKNFWDPSPGTFDKDGNPVAGLVSGQGGIPILYGEGPTYASNPWEIVFLNNYPIPGLCKVKAAPTIRFDKKKPGGQDGLTITGQGYLPGPVEIEVLLWTSEQWDFFQAIADMIWIKPKRGSVALAIDIRHPGTDMWKITQIVVEGVSVPEDGPIPQSKVIKIKGFEFLPPDKKSGPKTVKASGNPPVDKHVDRADNGGGPSPGVTGTSPNGKPTNWVTP